MSVWIGVNMAGLRSQNSRLRACSRAFELRGGRRFTSALREESRRSAGRAHGLCRNSLVQGTRADASILSHGIETTPSIVLECLAASRPRLLPSGYFEAAFAEQLSKGARTASLKEEPLPDCQAVDLWSVGCIHFELMAREASGRSALMLSRVLNSRR